MKFRKGEVESLRLTNDNPKDRINVILGDDKQDAFFPQIKLERWDNEVNLSVRLKDFDNFTKSEKGNVVHLKNHKKEVKLYELEPGDKLKDGGFEFEVILNEKPKTNVVEFSLNTKGLDFYYQPELTKEEKERGAVRSENVVGSYAVYASEQKINRVGGKEYKVGKVGHIYRPKIIDSKGTEVWGDLHIENGILSVTVPQKFLDKAVYPVVVDPTIGYTGSGGSWASCGTASGDNYAFGQADTTDASGGNGSEIQAYIKASSTSKNFVVAIYAGSTGTLNKVTNSDSAGQISGIGGSGEWGEFTLSPTPSLSASTAYVVACQGELSTTYVAYDTTTGGFRQSFGTYSSPLQATRDWASGPPFRFSIYCTYTAGGGGTAIKDIIQPGIIPAPR